MTMPWPSMTVDDPGNAFSASAISGTRSGPFVAALAGFWRVGHDGLER